MSAQETPELQFDPTSVRLAAHALDWRQAVGQMGELLAERGFAKRGYTSNMVRVIERFGPYVVVGPGVALVHARPGEETIQNGLAVITYPEGVGFGHARYDPVRVVVGMTATSASEHLQLIAALAKVFDNEVVLGELVAAASPESLVELLKPRLVAAGLAIA
ncbi:MULTISPECIES: PTS sugar transporter subunit IIA [unclassified Pseudoclavibacter]|jgi:PTS system ascorbate-specific IIA component|uniref:PTS sugar transporter subunit IIA n=1 Tax=unclassified Pseudoclavibacter TaxID=2615177 RepID=UPI000CE79767|nr:MULTISPECIES: PTS sugar transporter subunit IIA [unclassified Pseudoclavibacter]MBS3178558.1 PTS sugar transporter subunit IIA [Pseudoclavibacter sp. Marseille-Q4354]NYF15112.1 PTS system ascorbate-specific IIA component [Pseudoclavibacter sp. JAI123]PPG27517.1 PTS ascorbate transporter subunit IIA [Pseudoclavibacter sp. RFBB5]